MFRWMIGTSNPPGRADCSEVSPLSCLWDTNFAGYAGKTGAKLLRGCALVELVDYKVGFVYLTDLFLPEHNAAGKTRGKSQIFLVRRR